MNHNLRVHFHNRLGKKHVLEKNGVKKTCRKIICRTSEFILFVLLFQRLQWACFYRRAMVVTTVIQINPDDV